MRSLQFTGTVRSDRGAPSDVMASPGRDELIVAPDDWPTPLAPGTLAIDLPDLPDGLAEVGEGDGLARLDDGKFRAALVIPQRKIAGNPVPTHPDHPTQGFAQVWRAAIQVVDAGQAADCWMVRIIGSGSEPRLELVAEENLRDRLGLSEGTPMKINEPQQR